MDYIPGIIENSLVDKLFKGKTILLYGPRQSGKTTMLKHLCASQTVDALWLNGDSPDVREMLESITATKWRAVLAGKKIVVVDEAQRIPGIGLSLKLLVDECSDVQVIATGSSAFELADSASEPLTGRKYEFRWLLPAPILLRVLKPPHRQIMMSFCFLTRLYDLYILIIQRY